MDIEHIVPTIRSFSGKNVRDHRNLVPKRIISFACWDIQPKEDQAGDAGPLKVDCCQKFLVGSGQTLINRPAHDLPAAGKPQLG